MLDSVNSYDYDMECGRVAMFPIQLNGFALKFPKFLQPQEESEVEDTQVNLIKTEKVVQDLLKRSEWVGEDVSDQEIRVVGDHIIMDSNLLSLEDWDIEDDSPFV